MTRSPGFSVPVVSAIVLAGCFWRSGPPRALPPLPPPPLDTSGQLRISVVYPRLADTGTGLRAVSPIASRDSTFLFGSVGRGGAMLAVNGTEVPVYPNGAWLAWVPLPDDTIAGFELVARAGRENDRLVFHAPLVPRFRPPRTGPWIDTTALSPVGDRWVRPGEGVVLVARASPGAAVQARLPDSSVIVFVRELASEQVPWGERAFGTVPPPASAGSADRYVARWVGPLGPDPGHVLSPAFPAEPADSRWIWLEVIEADDTARARWPLRLGVVDTRHPPVAVVNDDTAGTGVTDGMLAGRPTPRGTYHWFFPNGTTAAVSGRWNDQVRLQLSRNAVAWVDVTDIQPLRPGTPAPGGRMQPLRLYPGEGSVTLRIPLPGRVPFRVDEDEERLAVTLYNVGADADWIQYGGTDPLVRLIEFHAPAEDETVVEVHLAEPVWGYRTRWSGDDLLVEIRRPPVIELRRPLRGRVIALDAGHPPLGATGPTGTYEADVVLAVARKARTLLQDEGARVVMVRSDDRPLGLVARVQRAEQAGAEVLVSIHANALPDGVNPFVNNGTSVYYFHPRSAPLAREVTRALVRQLGARDLGMGRGDLALVRATWMPAILTEGLFMMVPEQEAVLGSDAGQWRYARGIMRGIEAFLAARARRRR